MKQVPIREAERICKALRARGAVVIVLTPVTFSCVSYGESKRECRQMADFLDAIVTKLADGSLKPWGGAG